LNTNINQFPRRITLPDPPGNPRASWNATEPAVLVVNGEVFDVQMRYHGSRYRRDASRQDYKIDFPRYHRLADGRGSLYLTDKGTATYLGSGEGPYYIGNAALPPAKPGWTVRQRCEWTYTPQINDWKGGADVEQLLTGLWAARGDSPTAPHPNVAALRPFLE